MSNPLNPALQQFGLAADNLIKGFGCGRLTRLDALRACSIRVVISGMVPSDVPLVHRAGVIRCGFCLP